MHVDFRGLHIDRAESLRVHAERRVESAVSRFSDRILTVHVRLTELNGPRGGVDKLCRVQVHGRGLDLVVEDMDADPYIAIDRATHRLGRSVRRAVDRVTDAAAGA